MPRAKIISFINYKGGVGKTTTTYHIGCSLAQHHNKKVLMVDIDPQTNLTFLCADVAAWEDFKRRVGTVATMYQRFLDGKTVDAKRFVWKSPIQVSRGHRIANVDLIPCDVDLLGEDLGGGQISGIFPTIELLRRQAKAYLRERTFLRSVFRQLDDVYDYILIDCPPNLYLMTQNALVASSAYVITAIPDHLSTIGLTILRNKVEKIRQMIRSAQTFTGETDKGLSVAALGGVVFVKVRIGGTLLTNTHAAKMTEVESLLGSGSCFETHTTELIGYSEAAENQVPVWMHDSTNARRAARKDEYQDITRQFVRRF